MVELIIFNNRLRASNDSIKYTLQCNDIANLDTRQTNYTNSFTLPKTSENTLIFQNLGIVGDVSDVPYKKVNCSLVQDGFYLIHNGWLDVTETATNYKVNVRDGLIDLYKAIENKNFGADTDISEIDHQKNLSSIIASFTNENYRYIINDYGGLTHAENGTKINIDYLIPSVRVKYLWDKIFTTFGFEYSGDFFDTTDFSQLWITYPKGNEVETAPTLYAELLEYNTFTLIFQTINVNVGLVNNQNTYKVLEKGTYKIEAEGQGFIPAEDEYDINEITNAYPLINGVLVFNGVYELNIGDDVTISIEGGPYNVINLRIWKYDTGISFSEELKKLTITDFFKEILNRFCLTIFVDIDGVYHFKTFDERLKSGVIDWTDKFMERTSETYTPKTYAQKNKFVENYNDKIAPNYNDGYFIVANENLNETKELIKSKMYTSEKEPQDFYINPTTTEVISPTLLWQREANENNGTVKVKYKTLDNRFYFLYNETINKTATLKSALQGNEQVVSTLPIARFKNTTFKDLVPKYYGNIKTLLDSFRMHKIKLALHKFDIINLDFDKIYYFKQEQNYYILNKVTYEEGKISNAEFYRVKYTEAILLKRHYSNLHYNTEHYSTNLI